ncbi:mycofactocin-coupled SDR family oxidoreductase [Mycobacterium intracellulare]|uniref:mycofactocin-coupled SDR family oxidoreductase n=1 Tax=Mycobacterium intracellulare TaxID=1767 RepID=UPI00080B35B3|nr:mycofactocin-coupled SDR family oxidoreductase [Mycobacterium intracellulare]OCB17808.1 3-ketoacyl-ACP reductase [Mycobacterium intracellulare subsp. yongonense]
MGSAAGKVAVITGAARGQGRSHAVRFAQEGADIVAIDFADSIDSVAYPLATEEDLRESVRLVEDTGRRALAITADVRDRTAVEKAVAAALEAFGRIDILSANAGILSYAPAADVSPEHWDDTIAVNLSGVWHIVRAVIPTMVAAKSGVIVLTSSLVGIRPVANALPYVAAKSGLVGMTKALAIELGPHNIRVNSVHPTTVCTDMVLNEPTYRMFRPDLENPTREDCEAAFASLQILPIPWIEPRDVTAAVVWLCSDEARYITGVNLPIDGGAAVK